MIDRLKNQEISAAQFRVLLRLEAILVALVLVLAYFAYQQWQQAKETTDNRDTQQRRLAALQDDLVFLAIYLVLDLRHQYSIPFHFRLLLISNLNIQIKLCSF